MSAPRMSRSRWYNHAAAVIRRIVAEAEAQQFGPEATRKLVDAAYPFGDRAYHPYRMGLKARRNILDGGHRKPPASPLNTSILPIGMPHGTYPAAMKGKWFDGSTNREPTTA